MTDWTVTLTPGFTPSTPIEPGEEVSLTWTVENFDEIDQGLLAQLEILVSDQPSGSDGYQSWLTPGVSVQYVPEPSTLRSCARHCRHLPGWFICGGAGRRLDDRQRRVPLLARPAVFLRAESSALLDEPAVAPGGRTASH